MNRSTLAIIPGQLRLVQRRARARGFTLIEAALATVIVGVGFFASLQLFASCTEQNRTAADMSTALMLTTNIREAVSGLSFADPRVGHTHFGPESGETLSDFNDVDDFDGSSLNPPIDSQREPIPSLAQYTQVVSVWPVNPNQLSTNSNEAVPDIPKGTYTGAVRVRVRVLFKLRPSDPAVEVYRASWIRMAN